MLPRAAQTCLGTSGGPLVKTKVTKKRSAAHVLSSWHVDIDRTTGNEAIKWEDNQLPLNTFSPMGPTHTMAQTMGRNDSESTVQWEQCPGPIWVANAWVINWRACVMNWCIGDRSLRPPSVAQKRIDWVEIFVCKHVKCAEIWLSGEVG